MQRVRPISSKRPYQGNGSSGRSTGKLTPLGNGYGPDCLGVCRAAAKPFFLTACVVTLTNTVGRGAADRVRKQFNEPNGSRQGAGYRVRTNPAALVSIRVEKPKTGKTLTEGF
jgi:hypothetical protein